MSRLLGTPALSAGFGAMLGATALWGISLAAPALLPDVSAPDLVAGRYLVYGLISVLLVLRGGSETFAVLRRHWLRASIYAVSANCGFYLLVTFAVRRAGPELAIATVGLLPICVSVAGNAAFQEATWSRLVLPSLVFASGLLAIGWSRITGNAAAGYTAFLGISAVVLAISGWSWYAVSNARFLRDRPDVGAQIWSSVIGIATLVVSLGWILLRPWVQVSHATYGISRTSSFLGQLTLGLIAMSVVLGVFSSWYATLLFNRASKLLPMALVGQLVVCETIFGVAYVHLLSHAPIAPATLVGFTLAIIGIGWSLHTISPQSRTKVEPVPRPAASCRCSARLAQAMQADIMIKRDRTPG